MAQCVETLIRPIHPLCYSHNGVPPVPEILSTFCYFHIPRIFFAFALLPEDQRQPLLNPLLPISLGTTCATICIAYLGCRPGVDRSGSQVDRGVLALGPHAGLNFSRAKRNRLFLTRTHPVCALSDRGSLDFNPGQPPC